jgi:FkbM family methyltransferase
MNAEGPSMDTHAMPVPLRPARLELRMRNELDSLAAEHGSGAFNFVFAGGGKLSRLRSKAKSALRAPADMVRRFLNAPVRTMLTQVEQRIDHNEIQQQALMNRVDQLTRMFGARMDEFEVKMRPLVTLDDAYAVRLGDGYILVPRDEPAFVLMLADATTGGLEPGTRACLKRVLQPGDTAVDIGANIGLLTMACARAVGFGGNVFSFEPEKRMADLLERTIAMNGLAQVKLFRQAVSAEPGTLSFNVSTIPGHSSLFALPENEAGHVQEVEVVRLDDVVPAGQRVDLVKIDVEGAEMEVVKGMRRILDENPNIVVVAEFGISHLRRVGRTSGDWFGAFEAHGLKGFAIEEPAGTCKPAEIERLEAIESANIAFVRPGTTAEKRLLA